MKNFDGKVAIVTGAATGIGYGISKRLANDGANLVMVDLDDNMMEQSASEIAARTQEVEVSIGDVSEPKTAQEAVSKAINKWGKIDIWVNNAGIGGVNGNIWELDVEEMDRVYRTNLRGVFSFCHEVVPHMLEKEELAGTGVLANCVTPAVVQTRILEEFTPEQVQYMVDRIPIGRTGEISEIAALVAWLSSDECSFSTGAVFDISGGRATY